MLFVENKDVPGVVGRLGLLLSEYGINIGEYILGRLEENNTGYSVIKILFSKRTWSRIFSRISSRKETGLSILVIFSN